MLDVVFTPRSREYAIYGADSADEMELIPEARLADGRSLKVLSEDTFEIQVTGEIVKLHGRIVAISSRCRPSRTLPDFKQTSS